VGTNLTAEDILSERCEIEFSQIMRLQNLFRAVETWSWVQAASVHNIMRKAVFKMGGVSPLHIHDLV